MAFKESFVALVAIISCFTLAACGGSDGDNGNYLAGVLYFEKSGSSITSITISENSSTLEARIVVDEDPDRIDSWVFEITSDNPSLLPQSNIALSGSGKFRTILITLVPGQTGTVNLTGTATTIKGGASISGKLEVIILPNVAPVADAGEDQEVEKGRFVLLNASGSSDSDGSIVSYTWTDGTTILSNNKTVGIADLSIGEHVITLTVTDDNGATHSDDIIVKIFNYEPVANAGVDQTVGEGLPVFLDASGSYDNGGTIVAYQWKEGLSTLSNSVSFSKSNFSIGEHTLTLTVTDNDGATHSDDVLLTVLADKCKSPILEVESYEFIDLGTLGGDKSMAFDINDAGKVVGSSNNENDLRRAFIYESGVMSDLGDILGSTEDTYRAFSINNHDSIVGDDGLDTGGDGGKAWVKHIDSAFFLNVGWESRANSINDAGVIVGSTDYPWSSRPKPFLKFPDGNIQDIIGGSCDRGSATAINNNNQIVGSRGKPGNLRCDSRAFLYEDGVIKLLGTLGGDDSSASDINENQCIVGSAEEANYGRPVAYLHSNNNMSSLGSLGGAESWAGSINDSNIIVGSAQTSSGEFHAFIYVASQMYDLHDFVEIPPEWDYLYSATAINNSGYIVGYGVVNTNFRAFLLVPETFIE